MKCINMGNNGGTRWRKMSLSLSLHCSSRFCFGHLHCEPVFVLQSCASGEEWRVIGGILCTFACSQMWHIDAKIILIKVVELKTLWKRLGRWTNVPFCNVTIKSWLTTAGYISAHSVLGLINFLYEVYSLSVRFNNSQSPQFLSSSLKQANGLRMAQEETLPPEMRYSTVYTAQC